MTEKDKIFKLFQEKPYTLRMGANTIGKRFNLNPILITKVRKELNTRKQKKGIKILVLDIETSPLKAYVWSRWKQNVYLEQTISEWFMLTWSAKWLGEKEVYSNRLNKEEVFKEDDSRIVNNLWLLLDEADVVVAHNGNRFDIPKINSRFILNHLAPPSPYLQIDTKVVAAKQFGFSSNKLDALAGYFGIRHKDETTFELWAECMKGNEESLEYMEKYNRGDIEILEEVYLRLRPYIKNHPNTGLFIEDYNSVCPTCGSKHIKEVHNKFTYTQTSKFKVIRCYDCGALSKSRVNSFPKEKRSNLIKSI